MTEQSKAKLKAVLEVYNPARLEGRAQAVRAELERQEIAKMNVSESNKSSSTNSGSGAV